MGNGHAHFTGEGAAQIEWTATNLASQILEVGRFGQTVAQDLDGLIDAFAGDAFLPFAEKFTFRFEEDLGAEFEDLSQVPHGLCGDGDWRAPQSGDELLLFERKVVDGGEPALAGLGEENLAHSQVEDRFTSFEVPGGEIAREFDRQELVATGRKSPCTKWLLSMIIVDLAQRWQIHLSAVEGKAPGAGQIQTDLDTVGMEAGIPGEGFGAVEVMPLDAEAELTEIPVQRAPTSWKGLPDAGLTEWWGQRAGYGTDRSRGLLLLGEG